MLPTKIFAATRDMPSLYGPPDFEVRNSVNNINTVNSINSINSTNNINTVGNTFKNTLSFFINIFFKVFAFALIPLIFIIGSIIFFKKSKLKTVYKILILIAVLVLLILLYFVGFYIIDQL